MACSVHVKRARSLLTSQIRLDLLSASRSTEAALIPNEKPKRLAPSTETLRELYLKSGNQCAFPGCRSPMINPDGAFVGQVCHIEAAEPGGERFNSAQSNEDRRKSSNLLLLCYQHHVETNDVSAFSVARVTRIKQEHEKKFSDVVGSILKSVVDHTVFSNPVKPESLVVMNGALGWELSSEHLVPMIEEVSGLIDRLCKVPIPARQLFHVIVDRATSEPMFGLSAPIPEIQQATGLKTRELRGLYSVLDKYGLASVEGNGGFGVQMVCVRPLQSGWRLWQDIKELARKNRLNLFEVIVNVDFSALD
jgi:hypothetical protein